MARLTILFLCTVFAMFVMGTKAEEGYCDFQDQKIPYGEFHNSEQPCQKIQCRNDGTISGIGCGTFPATPGCKLEKGTGPYPDCCEHPVCPE